MLILKFFKEKWTSILPTLLLILVVCYHFFETTNPPITQPVIISPITKGMVLKNNQVAQTKVATPGVKRLTDTGFSQEYVKDTIQGILNVTEKELIAAHKMTGTYKDSLEFVKEEYNAQKKLTKYYQSKDSKGNILGSASSTEGGPLVYKGNISLVAVTKKGVKKGPDSLIFYDPTQRVTINNSLEFSHPIPKTKKQKITLSTQVGVGFVAPGFKTQNIELGYYGGVGVSLNF